MGGPVGPFADPFAFKCALGEGCGTGDRPAEPPACGVNRVTVCSDGEPEDWPGFVFGWDLWRPGRVVKVELPLIYYDPRYHEPL